MQVKVLLLAIFAVASMVVTHGDVPNVITFKSVGYSRAEALIELNQIYDKFIARESQEVSGWDYVDVGYIYNQWLNVKNVRLNPNASRFTPEGLVHDFNLDSHIMDGEPGNMTLFFDFDWDAKNGIFSKVKGTGSFSCVAEYLTFTRQEIMNPNKTSTMNATFEINFNFTYKFTPYSDDSFLVEYFAKIFEKNVAPYIDKLELDFQKYTNQLYIDKQLTEWTEYKVNTTIPLTEYGIDLHFKQNPKYEIDRGVTYYLTGDTSTIVEGKGFLKAQPNHEIWDKFEPEDGDFQVFINHHILAEIISDISKSETFTFEIANENVPKGSGFLLTVESLGTIAPNLYKYLPRDGVLTGKSKLKNISVDMSDNQFVGQVTLSTSLYHEKRRVFAFEAYIRYNIMVEFNNTLLQMNFRVDSPIDVIDLTLLKTEEQLEYGLVDEHQLRTWISNSLSNHLVAKPFNVFSQNVNLKYFFRQAEIYPVPNEGIVIHGEPEDHVEPRLAIQKIVQQMRDSKRRN